MTTSDASVAAPMTNPAKPYPAPSSMTLLDLKKLKMCEKINLCKLQKMPTIDTGMHLLSRLDKG